MGSVPPQIKPGCITKEKGDNEYQGTVSVSWGGYKKTGWLKQQKFPSHSSAAAAAAKSLQSCPTLCDPIDGSPPGSPVPGILQARILEWVAISFSNAWKWKGKVKPLSRVRLLATPWTAAHQAPPLWDFPGKSTGVGCHHSSSAG